MKLSEWMDNNSEITLLNSPGGDTLQWGTEQQYVCLVLLVFLFNMLTFCELLYFSQYERLDVASVQFVFLLLCIERVKLE